MGKEPEDGSFAGSVRERGLEAIRATRSKVQVASLAAAAAQRAAQTARVLCASVHQSCTRLLLPRIRRGAFRVLQALLSGSLGAEMEDDLEITKKLLGIESAQPPGLLDSSKVRAKQHDALPFMGHILSEVATDHHTKRLSIPVALVGNVRKLFLTGKLAPGSVLRLKITPPELAAACQATHLRSTLQGRLELLLPMLAHLDRQEVRAVLPYLIKFDAIEDVDDDDEEAAGAAASDMTDTKAASDLAKG